MNIRSGQSEKASTRNMTSIDLIIRANVAFGGGRSAESSTNPRQRSGWRSAKCAAGGPPRSGPAPLPFRF